jgi:hypothetical protein
MIRRGVVVIVIAMTSSLTRPGDLKSLRSCCELAPIEVAKGL